MNQSDKIQMSEAKAQLLRILSDTLGASVEYFKIPEGPFNWEDLFNLIENIRVNNKYLLFDAEATRRELEFVQKILKDSNDS